MMTREIIFVFFVAVLVIANATVADARPVSYPGGWTMMFMNNGDANTAHLHYSPTAKYSVGYKFEHWRDRGFNLNAAQLNGLVKRWNEKDSQANFYVKGGIGIASERGTSNDDMAGFAGISTDWENRRLFFQYENRYTEAGNIDDFFGQSARVGWAPYEGDYGDLHTWLMVEVDHSPESEDSFTVTPLMRFFKGVHLVEAGMSNQGEALFNYVLRY